MGMYTKLDFEIQLKNDTPDHIKEILKYMTGQIEKYPDCPLVLELFKTTRWHVMLRCSDGKVQVNSQLLSTNKLVVQSAFKNYDDELALFLEWITPFVEEKDVTIVGTVDYEGVYGIYHILWKDESFTLVYEEQE